MDRKAYIAVALAILTMIWWQWYSLHHAPPPPQAPKAAHSATSPIAQTADPRATAGSQPATGAPAASAAQEEPEARIEIQAPSTTYVFTSKGGGVLFAKLREHGVTINEHEKSPIGAVTFQPGQARADWSLSQGPGTVIATRQEGPLRITKTFRTPGEDDKKVGRFIVKLEVTFANTGDALFAAPKYYVHTGALGPLHETDQPTYTAFSWFRGGRLADATTMWFDPAYIPLIGIQTRAARSTYEEVTDRVAWAGVRNQYFTSLITPVTDVPARRIGAGGWAKRFDFFLDPEGRELHGLEGALIMPALEIPAGQSVSQAFELYAGPREFTLLKQRSQDEDRIMNFGMFRIVSEFLLTSMHWLKGFLGNYGLAIIVLTVIIKLCLWPLQQAATNSAKKMQLLAPRLKELQEKYKDEPLRAQQEYSKMLKEYGVNPFGGCLPMLVTIPIFFGFFWMLGQAIELRGASFLWVSDLSQPDTIARIPFIRFPINILPLIMAATSFWQMALMPKTGDPVQQRIFMFLPLIFIAFCYNFASALSLYYTVQNLFSIVQLYATRNQPMPKLEKIQVEPAKSQKRKRRP